jgi:PAS domain-containing protein
MAPHLFTIPSTDEAFRKFVHRTLDRIDPGSPDELERRLRQTYPRVLVRERGLTGEVPSWYVYRDGAWRAPDHEAWWEDPAAPHVSIDAQGWIEKANPTARGVLGIADDDREARHFTDFVVPGGLDDAMALFEIARAAGSFEATIVLQPTTGDAIAVDIKATTRANGMTAAFRLASDIDVPAGTARTPPPERIEYRPPTDVAFRAYAERALARIPEPTPGGLGMRLRRLYPHARVEAGPDGWIARRDHQDGDSQEPWWLDEALPRVRYDAMALILDANNAATAFFGRSLVDHHWQEFVTAGSTDEVAIMLDILAEAGAAESRFRMPRGDGSLLEFDSYTVVDGAEFSTVFRPVPPVAAVATAPVSSSSQAELVHEPAPQGASLQ